MTTVTTILNVVTTFFLWLWFREIENRARELERVRAELLALAEGVAGRPE